MENNIEFVWNICRIFFGTIFVNCAQVLWKKKLLEKLLHCIPDLTETASKNSRFCLISLAFDNKFLKIFQIILDDLCQSIDLGILGKFNVRDLTEIKYFAGNPIIFYRRFSLEILSEAAFLLKKIFCYLNCLGLYIT